MHGSEPDATSENPALVEATLAHREMPKPPAVSGRFGRLVDALGRVVATFFLVSTGIVLYEIVSRYVFDAPTRWAHETTTFLCAVGFLFGGLYALSHDRHIRVVLIYEAVPETARRWFDVVISSVGLISVLFFAYAAWATVERSWFAAGSGEVKLETSGSAFDAPYPALIKGLLFAVVVAMAVQFVIQIVNTLRAARRARRGPTDGGRS